MHKRTRLLLTKVISGRAAHKKCAIQVNVDHLAPFFIAHFMKETIAQVTGVIDDDINATKMLDRTFDDAVGARAR